MTNDKIDALLDEIKSSILNDFSFKMSEVLSLCDSSIEKLFILHLFHYFNSCKGDISWMNQFKTEFIEDSIFLHVYESDDRKYLQELINKYNYRKTSSCFLKYIGFKISENFSEPGSNVFREFEIYPQKRTFINNEKYIVDIAITMNRIENGKVIQVRKIALECDGYDYHSSPIQKRNDDIRSRKLKSHGWRDVLRYSGTEIYHLKESNIDQIFKEIIQILYL